MSARRNKQTEAGVEVAKLRGELEDLKAQTRTANEAYVASHIDSHQFDQLSPTEQSAASLGVSPSSWKPISFLNNKHYDALIKANALDDSLARRIEVRIEPRPLCLSLSNNNSTDTYVRFVLQAYRTVAQTSA